MPSSITAAIASSLGVAASSTAYGFIAAAVYIALAAASYAISSSLAPKPRQQGNAGDSLGTQTVSGTGTAEPWRIVYGRTRVGGNYAFKMVSYSPGYITELHVVPSAAPYQITIAAADRYIHPVWARHEYVSSEPDDGGQVLTEELTLVGSSPTGLQYSVGAGGVHTFPSTLAGENVRVSYGAYYAGTDKFLSMVLVLAAHQIEAVDQIYFDDVPVALDVNGYVTTAPWNGGYAQIFKHLGVPGEAADPILVSTIPTHWTVAHRLEGHAYLYIKLFRGGVDSPWNTGIPNISAEVRGKNDILDPRSATYGYTNNWALCLADYLAFPYGVLKATYGTTIDNDDLIAAANVCDESVSLVAGGTESRYTLNGVVSLGDTPRTALRDLVPAGSGRLTYISGKWRIHAGAYVAPVYDFGEDDMAGPVTVTTRLSHRDALNTVTGSYAGPESKWQVVDAPPLESATFIAEDGGERLAKDTLLRYTDTAARAQRLFKIDLLRARQQITVEISLKINAFVVRPPDTFSLTLPRYGWTAKVFECTELTLDFVDNAPVIKIIGRETDSTIFDWSTSEESPIDPAPNTSLANPLFIGTPGVPTVTEVLYYVPGFSVKVKARVAWTEPQGGNSNVRYRLQWKKTTDATWNEKAGLTVTTDDILDIESASYLFRVAAYNEVGTSSLWAQREYTVSGLIAAPNDVKGFAITTINWTVFAQWVPTVDLDVRYGGFIIIRHSPATSGAAWENAIDIGTFGGAEVRGQIPALVGTYFAKFVDSSGNFSTNAASVTLTDGDLVALASIATVDESSGSPTFEGAMSNIVYDAGLGGIRIDDLSVLGTGVTAIDEWISVNPGITLTGTGAYEFHTYVDLGAVVTARFQASISAQSYDTGDLLDSRLTLMDDWDDWDGVTVNDCFAVLYISLTDNDPSEISPTPVWGEWRPFVVSDFTCRAAKFKLELGSASTNHNISISSLVVDVKAIL